MEELKQNLITTINQFVELDANALKIITESIDESLSLSSNSNTLTVKEIIDILDDCEHLDDAKAQIRAKIN